MTGNLLIARGTTLSAALHAAWGGSGDRNEEDPPGLFGFHPARAFWRWNAIHPNSINRPWSGTGEANVRGGGRRGLEPNRL